MGESSDHQLLGESTESLLDLVPASTFLDHSLLGSIDHNLAVVEEFLLDLLEKSLVLLFLFSLEVMKGLSLDDRVQLI